MSILLAQVPDAVPGTAGYFGAGLLGCVLYWLMFHHLPAKDKQLKEIIDSKDVLVSSLATTFKISLQVVVDHCESESGIARGDHREQMSVLQSLWTCFMSSAAQEIVEKGLGRLNSPLSFTSGASEVLADLITDLTLFYLEQVKNKPSITELELFVAFDQKFGDTLVSKLEKDYGLSRGACLVMAIGVCRLHMSSKSEE